MFLTTATEKAVPSTIVDTSWYGPIDGYRCIRGPPVTRLQDLPVRDASPAVACVPIDATRMSKADAEATAAVFKALADPARVRIVNLLAASGAPVCVCHLTDLLELTQPTVSFHMRKLMDAGLLEREQRGVWAYYSLRDDARQRLRSILAFEEVNDG
jgi:ArsR family transcriptional regulator, arsenate/arsenite/antimonite-responsive transcriptional repressor